MHVDHLTCYQAKQTNQPKFAKRVGVFLRNQFGPEVVDVRKPTDLCIPATIAP